MAARLRCERCRFTAALDPAVWRCGRCGEPLDLIGEPPAPVSLGAVATPLVALPAEEAIVKVEGMLPTGSFKDRGAACLVGGLVAAGVTAAVADSSGNAGAAIAAHCARAGIALDLYVPASAAPAKLVQARAHGAHVVAVPGDRQTAAAAALAAVATGAVYATHAWSPLFVAGTRGFARELVADLGDAPDAIVLPVGSGTLLLGCALELAALRARGEISRLPRLHAIQSAACAPIGAAFAAGSDEPAAVAPAPGAAEGVLVPRPARGRQVLAAVRASGGSVEIVADEALPAALRRLGGSGLLVEPTAALALAGLDVLRATGRVAAGEQVVLAATGHGLKAPAAIASLLWPG
jgi:threonine synthase